MQKAIFRSTIRSEVADWGKSWDSAHLCINHTYPSPDIKRWGRYGGGMAEAHVLTALVEKYRELSGKLSACEKEAVSLKGQLSHIDAAIRIFRDDYDTGAILPKRPYRRNPHFKKGVFIRSALDVLREAAEPLSARELAKLWKTNGPLL